MIISFTAAAALAALPIPYGGTFDYSGVFTSATNLSMFDRCWLTFSPKAAQQFYSMVPASALRGHLYHLQFKGRNTPMMRHFFGEGGFGHLGKFPCQIQILDLRSARAFRPAAR